MRWCTLHLIQKECELCDTTVAISSVIRPLRISVCVCHPPVILQARFEQRQALAQPRGDGHLAAAVQRAILAPQPQRWPFSGQEQDAIRLRLDLDVRLGELVIEGPARERDGRLGALRVVPGQHQEHLALVGDLQCLLPPNGHRRPARLRRIRDQPAQNGHALFLEPALHMQNGWFPLGRLVPIREETALQLCQILCGELFRYMQFADHAPIRILNDPGPLVILDSLDFTECAGTEYARKH